jgi:hypothetical protein
MKHSLKVAKPKHKKATKPPEPRTEKRPDGTSALPRWVVLTLCLLIPAGSAWGVFEFFVWSKLPPELVGKWVVQGGPQDGATFDFSRRGTVEAHLNHQGMEHILQGTAAVKDRTLLITTQNPHTRQEETRSCNIRELTPRSLIVEFETGEVFRMTRAQ